jgi:2-aminoethylphosphonate dioxygenase
MNSALSEGQLEEYRARGYLLLRGLFDAEEVAAWDAESRRLLRLGLGHEENVRAVLYRAGAGLSVLDRLSPVVDISPVFAALARDPRIMRPLAELYGGDMLLFKDKLIYKMIGVPGYPLHQDYSSWQTFPRDLANVLVSIDAADATNGGVEFFPGYHGALLSAPGELRYMNDDESKQLDLASGETLKTGPGDAIIFDCLTPHRSGVNDSNRLRRQLYLTYSSAANGDMYGRQLEYIEGVRRSRAGAGASRLFFR